MPHQADQAAQSSQAASLQRMSQDQRMSLEYPSMAPGAMSLDGNNLGSIRSQLATCLGFPASASERSGSLVSSGSMASDTQTSLGGPGFIPGSHPQPIQRPRRNASGQVYWL